MSSRTKRLVSRTFSKLDVQKNVSLFIVLFDLRDIYVNFQVSFQPSNIDLVLSLQLSLHFDFQVWLIYRVLLGVNASTRRLHMKIKVSRLNHTYGTCAYFA